MPRKSTEEMIADLEQKLAKARETAVTRVQTTIEKLEEKRRILESRIAKLTSQVKDVDDEIAKLKADDKASFTATQNDEV